MNNEEKNKLKHKINSLLIIIFGIVLRTYHLFIVGFSKPWKFGGLFLEFSRQIFLNNYRFPERIPNYTFGGIPFAYPPLPFYLESFLTFTLGLPEFLVVNLLPAIASVISLFLFYFLITKLLKNKWAQLFTLLFFALFPIGYAEQIEGAGLAESIGTFFIILLILSFWRFYQNPHHFSRLLLSAFVWALAVMASPGSAYVSVLIFLTLLVLLIREHKNNLSRMLLQIVILGLLAMLISSIYWGTVIRIHGLDLLIKSFTNQHNGGINMLGYLILRIGAINLINSEVLLSVLFMIGLCVLAYYQKFEILVLALFSAMIPREDWLMGIIGVLVIGFSLDLVLHTLDISFKSLREKKFPYIFVQTIIVIMIVFRPISFMVFREIASEQTIDQEQVTFLQSIDEIDDIEENLVIISNNEFLEWSPYLTEKTVLNVWYGTEFAPKKFWIEDVHESLMNCNDTTCINHLIRENFEVENFSVIVDLSFKEEFNMAGEGITEEQPSEEIYDHRFLYYSIDQFN